MKKISKKHSGLDNSSTAHGVWAKAKIIHAKSGDTVELPKGYKPNKKPMYWRKTASGYLLTTKNEFDELIEFLDTNSAPDSLFTERPEQLPH